METETFSGVTVFILASNETNLLCETVAQVRRYCADEDLDRIVLVLKDRTCPAYETAQALLRENDRKLELYVQKKQGFILCLTELPPQVQSSHFVIMASDMETDPQSLEMFIRIAKAHPRRIVCAAKWHRDSEVTGYGTLHALCSRALNLFVSAAAHRRVYDPISFYQIYPLSVYKEMQYSQDESFLFEYTLKPLILDAEYAEIPTRYHHRSEGHSNFKFGIMARGSLTFCATALRIYFKSKPHN